MQRAYLDLIEAIFSVSLSFFSVNKMPDMAQGGFRLFVYQRPAPGQSDVYANLPGYNPQGCRTFQHQSLWLKRVHV